jgi:tetratricopeptide (TPR) repeat protein
LAGIEFASGGAAFFRLGYDHGLESPFTYGLGFRAGEVLLDYAFAPLGDLGNTHHVGIAWRVGNPAEAYYEKGMDYFRQEDYARAVVYFNRALAADPRHAKALLKLREANQHLQKKWDDSPR